MELKLVYLSLGDLVFDVSKGSNFYSPGGLYKMFGRQECGVSLEKLSFDEEN